MNVKEAISQAKVYARDVFDDEQMSNLGVEEVDSDGNAWHITLGLSRPWDNTVSTLAMVSGDIKSANRSYHVFTISDKDRSLINIRLRDR